MQIVSVDEAVCPGFERHSIREVGLANDLYIHTSWMVAAHLGTWLDTWK